MTRQRRITDILNNADDRFLVLAEVTSDEFGSRGETIRAEFAQINLASVLFAVADTSVETPPELRTPKVPEEVDLGAAVQGHWAHPPHARAQPARGADRADRPLCP